MKTKHLLAALALPALVACTQDEALVNGSQNVQFEGKPLENVTFSFTDGEGADTKMINNGWNLNWKAGDQVGLVWVNAPEIQLGWGSTYDPTVLPKTAFWASNTRMTCTNAGGSVFEMQDGQVLEGQYFAYYPYSNRQTANSKFEMSVAAVQTQETTDMDNAAGVLSYVVDNMPWISRRADLKSATYNKDAAFFYPLTNGQAGMSKKIDMEMFRFANLLDARIKFEKGDCDINPEDIKILRVDLLVECDVESWSKQALAVDGTFNMGAGGGSEEFGVISIQDKEKYELDNTLDETRSLFWNKTLLDKITTKIASPVAKSEGRVNFLLMPLVDRSKCGNNYFKNDQYKLALDIHTNYGHIVVSENDWMQAKAGTTGLPVWGPNTDAQASLVTLDSDAAYYAGNGTNHGWSNRTGAFCTRYVDIDVADLEYESPCIHNETEFYAELERINQRGEENKSYELCIDGTDGILDLNNLDWSAESTNDAIAAFLANNNTLVLKEHTGMDVVVKLNGENQIAASNFTLTNLDLTVAEDATLDVNVNFNTDNGAFVSEENSIVNVNGVVLTTGVAELNGETNILIVENNAGELKSTSGSENNGTINVKGILDVWYQASNYGTINLFHTAVLNGVLDNGNNLVNEGTINYYYAEGKPSKVTITNQNGGEFKAEYNNGEVPGASQTFTMTDFLKAANSYGVSTYVIAKATDANTVALNLSNATKIVVKDGVKLTFAPNTKTDSGLTATKAEMIFEGANELASAGDYKDYAKVYVKDITLGYGAVLTNGILVQNGGTLKGIESDGKANYTVVNNGYIWGGKVANQTGAMAWEGKAYGVQKQ